MINTENKRRSVVGLWAVIRVLPVPDLLVDAGDRAHIWIYRGHFDEDHNAIFFGINA